MPLLKGPCRNDSIARADAGRSGPTWARWTCAARAKQRGQKVRAGSPRAGTKKLAPALSRAPLRSLGPDGPAGRLTRRGYPAIGTGASSGLVGYWGRWRRVPASAGARHLKVRRHLLLRVLRRRASWTRSTPGAPLARPAPPLRAPQPPRAPHAPIPHLPAAARSRPCVRLRAQAPTIFQGVGRRRTRRTTSAAPTTPRPAVAAAVAPVAALVAASALAAPVAAPCSAPLF